LAWTADTSARGTDSGAFPQWITVPAAECRAVNPPGRAVVDHCAGCGTCGAAPQWVSVPTGPRPRSSVPLMCCPTVTFGDVTTRVRKRPGRRADE